MNCFNKAALQSYLRTALSACTAMWMAGNHDPKSLGIAAISAILGPLMRCLNPNDPAFGVVKETNSQG